MTNIKTFKDGSRLIIVVENCTGDLATKVNNFLLDLLGTTEAQPVPEVIPEETKEEVAPIVEEAEAITVKNPTPFEAPAPEDVAKDFLVEGDSGTFGEALRRKDTQAVVWATVKANKADESIRQTLVKMCKQYIYNDCASRDPEITSTEEIKKFISIYKPIIGGAIKQILGSSGYATLDDFFDLADEYIHQDAYRVIIEEIMERSK